MKTSNIIEILKRKKKGVDCTEAESAELKGFIRKIITNRKKGLAELKEETIRFDKIRVLFPIEFGEATDDIETIKRILEYLRQEINAERISQEEIFELQSLAKHIDKGDVQLLEWAGVPEFSEKYVVTDIDWDAPKSVSKALPKEITVVIPDDEDLDGYMEIQEYISDKITELTGYCHNGFATTPEINEK